MTNVNSKCHKCGATEKDVAEKCTTACWVSPISRADVDAAIRATPQAPEPVAKKQIEVGGSYVSNNGQVWKCFCIDGGCAWMKRGYGGTAYLWSLDGKGISLNEEYDIAFTRSAPVETTHVLFWMDFDDALTVKRCFHTHKITITHPGKSLPHGQYTGPDGAKIVVEEV